MRLRDFSPRCVVLPTLLLLCLLQPRPAGSRDLDVEIEKLLGAQVAFAFRDTAGVDNDPLLAGWVQQVGKRVSRVSPRQNVPYSFTILGTDVANAFAAPAGYVFVTRGLLDTIDSDDELATILAHETGHVTKRHAVQQVGGNLLVLGIIASLKDDKYRQVRSVAALANVFRTLYKSRQMESQADDLGLQYAYQSGYDPGGMIQFFNGYDLRGRSKLAEYFDTHPSPASRMKVARGSKYVQRNDLALRELTAKGFEERGLTTAAARTRAGLDPLTLPPYIAPTVPEFLQAERDQVRAQAGELRQKLLRGYKAQDIGSTLKQILLINNQADVRWLYVSARAYAVQARVEDLFARTLRVADTAPGTYDALAQYANGPAVDMATRDSSAGRENIRTALTRAEGAVAPIERAARAVTTVLVDLNNRFWRLNNDSSWLRYGSLEALLRYAESELARADRASGVAWRQLSLARIRRYQHWLNQNLPENDPERRARWAALATRRFGSWFPDAGPAGDVTVRAALAVEKRDAALKVESGRGDTLWADWSLKQKGVPENIATAMRLLALDCEREFQPPPNKG